MIEIICKEESAKENPNKKEETICLPKNIRQEGSPRGRHKIYLEDYVYTYLKNMAKSKENCAAVFLGKSQVEKDIRYTFISGLVECSAAVFQWDSISLDDSFWDYIYKEEKQYFPDLVIVGWFLGKAGQVMELSPAVEAAHRKYFSGRDKILMLMDILEEEELFFVYEQGYLQKREGYYIYYEKNLAMQEYMICKREEEERILEELKTAETEEEISEMESEPQQEVPKEEEPLQFVENLEELEDKKENSQRAERDAKAMLDQMRRQEKKAEKKMRDGLGKPKTSPQNKIFAKSNLEEPKSQAEEALDAYRRTILERQGKSRERENRKFLYTASSFLLVVISVIGITTINNYRKMQKVEEVLRVINPEAPAAKSEHLQEDKGLVVESIESQITPLEDSTENQDGQKENEDAKVKDNSQKPEESPSEKSGEMPKNPEQGEESEDVKPEEEPKDTNPEQKTIDTKSQEDTASKGSSHGEKPEGKQDKTQETAAQAGEPRYYTVQPGDSLSTICDTVYKNKSMIRTLKEVNGIEDGDKIYAGQRLLLP